MVGVRVEPEPDALRIGIVGAGWAAAEHCKTLARLEGITIAAVADPDARRSLDLARPHQAGAYPTATEMIADETLDAVVVATPPGAHREASIEAIEAGLSVFLEKPISRSVDDAWAIVAAATRANAVCAVGYQWRAIPALEPLSEALRSEGLRHLVSEGIGVTQARSWFLDDAMSGRLIAERGSHHLDLQRRVGGEIIAVQAAGSDLQARELDRILDGASSTETSVLLTLHFASGALGAVHVIWVPEGYPSRQRLTAFGTVSTYELELDPTFSLRRNSGEPLLPDPTAEHPFAAGLVRFIDAARRNDPEGVVCTPLEAAKTLEVVVACEHALVTGETVHVGQMPRSGVAP